jgi:hypothetical protein
MKHIFCILGFHIWEYSYVKQYDTSRKRRKCKRCNKLQERDFYSHVNLLENNDGIYNTIKQIDMTETEKHFDNIFNEVTEDVKPVKETVESLKKQIDILVEKRDEKMEKLDFSKVTSFKELESNIEPEQGQIEALIKKSRLIKVPEYENIPDYGDHMSFSSFKEACIDGMFIDYDGCGNYATKDKMTNIGISPSDIKEGVYRKEFTHVIWFNK